jgi:hypothetical protein
MPHSNLDSQILQKQSTSQSTFPLPTRRQSQHSEFAKAALMSKIQQAGITTKEDLRLVADSIPNNISHEVLPPPAIAANTGLDGTVSQDEKPGVKPRARFAPEQPLFRDGFGAALSDTPAPSIQNSPRMYVLLSSPELPHSLSCFFC